MFLDTALYSWNQAASSYGLPPYSQAALNEEFGGPPRDMGYGPAGEIGARHSAVPLFKLNPALRPFWQAQARYKALYGGRASSKSHDAAGFSIFLTRIMKLKIMCARQFQNRIDESVYTLIKNKIEEGGLTDEYAFTKNSIIHRKTGSEYLFYGIARNINEIKSTEGVDILWLEEAQYLTEEQWNIIEPTIRKEGSQIWLIWNPDELLDFIYQRFVVNPPPDCVSRHINWNENGFLSETMLKIIHNAYIEDKKKAEHIYGGIPKTGGDKSVINLEFILASIDAHKKVPDWPTDGKRRIGFDVADDGDDKNATTEVRGNIIWEVDEWEGLEDQLLKSCTKVFNKAKDTNAEVTYDSIGVGAHVGSKFKEINDEGGHSFKLSYDAFNAGGKVRDPEKTYMKLPHVNITNQEHFSNIKAQEWDAVATMFRKTYEVITQGAKHPTDELISINSETIPPKLLNQMCQELAAPRKDVDGLGKFKVESKKDMKEKRGIKSPNIADSVIMAVRKPKRKSATFF